MQKSTTSRHQLEGVWTAIVTPFRGRSINFEALDQLVERAIAGGVTGLMLLGTTGESPVVTPDERTKIIDHVIKTARKRIKIYVGAGSNDTKHALHQTKSAAELGADGLLIVTPYYNKPTEDGLRKYFLTLANSSDIPIVLYHIPGRCAVGISHNLTLELAEHPQIIGIKDAGGDVARVSELVRYAPREFRVLSGDDGLTLPMMSVGAVGVVSVVSNIVPEHVVQMVNSALGGNFAAALKSHQRLADLTRALFLETSPAPIKEALGMAGIDVGKVRPPLVPVTSKTKTAIKKALVGLGVIS